MASGRAGICSLVHLAEKNDWTSEQMEKAADATGYNWREARLADKYREFINKRG
jgi:hypothetical protein